MTVLPPASSLEWQGEALRLAVRDLWLTILETPLMETLERLLGVVDGWVTTRPTTN